MSAARSTADVPVSDQRRVEVAGGGGAWGVLRVGAAPHWRLQFGVGGRSYVSEGVDSFESLVSLRRQLEADGLLLCVNGARSDVFPSGMSRQMGGGRKAYVLVPGRTPTTDDLVDILDPAPSGAVVTVSEQYDSVRRFHRS